MDIGFAIDGGQGLSDAEELRLVALGAELGYQSAWTPSRADATAFERCIRWNAASGLPVGISAVPASGRSAGFYAEQAARTWTATQRGFTLVVGSGNASPAAEYMRTYLPEVRAGLPPEMPLYLAALGPRMLDLGGQVADGVALNWCTEAQVAWSRERLTGSAHAVGRAVPRVVEYIRTCVDADAGTARSTVAEAARGYTVASPAYHRHFERMGFADELQRLDRSGGIGGDSPLGSVGAAGTPGKTRAKFDALAHGLDLAIVRILVVKGSGFESARRALEECRPA